MAKSKSTKREFDWRTYSKPQRLLTAEQEQAFASGILSPILTWARDHDAVRFEIRARQAAIYDAGTMLLRVRGAEPPFSAEIDANVRLPRMERTGAERLETWPLETPQQVSAVVAELGELRTLNAGFASSTTPSERSLLHAFATANEGRWRPDARYVVADTEYQYGRRRFDFVGMRRVEGVGGSAAFTTPRLVFGQFKSAAKSVAGNSGLVAHAADFVDFVQALGGEHLEIARAELDELVAQKLRLGLMCEDIPFRHFTQDDPEYLVVLAGPDVASVIFDAPLAETHDKLVSRHYRSELLRFAALDCESGAGPAPLLALGDEDALSYREFKQLRKRLRVDEAEGPNTTRG